MREYEIYLPTTNNSGKPVDERIISATKEKLTEVFGGYTHLKQRNEGVWRMGGATFHDEITIIRVIDDLKSRFDWQSLKRELEQAFGQQSVLIVVRVVEIL